MSKKIRDSYIELFFHKFWFPEWQIIKIKNHIYNIEHIESFCATAGLKQCPNAAEIKIFLVVEIIASTMMLAESLATLLESIIKNPKNLQEGYKVAKPTKFYKSIESLDYNAYMKILSAPQKESICDEEVCNLDEKLNNFSKLLSKFKDYYFRELDLYNSYKHGFRLFLTETYQGEGNFIDTLAYFSQTDNHNKMHVRCIEEDPYNHLNVAKEIAKVMRILLSNYENMNDNPENYEITIPEKQ